MEWGNDKCIFRANALSLSGFYESHTLAMCHLTYTLTTGANVGINEHETLILILGKKGGMFLLI